MLAPKNYLRCQTIKLFTLPICIITQSLVLVALTIVLPSWNEDGDDDYDDDAHKKNEKGTIERFTRNDAQVGIIKMLPLLQA